MEAAVVVKIDGPTRGDLKLMLREFALRAPDARVVAVEHDDGCPAIQTGEDCSCEVVVMHVEGLLPPDVAW